MTVGDSTRFVTSCSASTTMQDEWQLQTARELSALLDRHAFVPHTELQDCTIGLSLHEAVDTSPGP